MGFITFHRNLPNSWLSIDGIVFNFSNRNLQPMGVGNGIAGQFTNCSPISEYFHFITLLSFIVLFPIPLHNNLLEDLPISELSNSCHQYFNFVKHSKWRSRTSCLEFCPDVLSGADRFIILKDLHPSSG